MRLPLIKNALLAATLLAALTAPPPAAARQAAAVPEKSSTLLLEPETFAVLGSWLAQGNLIRSVNKPAVAFAGFNIATPGTYHVWTRSFDSTDREKGSRRFLLRVDGAALARESGRHGHDGFWWENVGSLPLDAGTHILEIDDTRRHYGRLEAILLTSTPFDPNTLPREALRRFLQPPAQLARVSARIPETAPPPAGTAPDAEIRNADVTVRFFTLPDGAGPGRPLVWRETVFHGAGNASLAHGVEPLRVIAREPDAEPARFEDNYYPAWSNATATTRWEIGGRFVNGPADHRDPFAAGKLSALLPVSVRAVGPRAVETTCRDAGGGLSATLLWTLPEKGRVARVEAALAAPEDAFWSMVFAPGPVFAGEDVSAVQLPPMHQYRRLPASPRLLPSAKTPHPLALVTARREGFPDGVTTGVFADPATLATEWPAADNSTHGFSLAGPAEGTQPHVFSPIPGGRGSRAAAGASVRASWGVAAAPGFWEGLMREADVSLNNLRDAREPTSASHTGQILNIIALLDDDATGGWLDALKGPVNIEAVRTATHAAPLAVLSAAVLTRDAGFYLRRALPTLEFMLTRPRPHSAFGDDAKNNSYMSSADARIAFSGAGHTPAVWEGADAVLARLNPWLRSYSKIAASGEIPSWSAVLAQHRRDGKPGQLAHAAEGALYWLSRTGLGNSTEVVPHTAFYNVRFYRRWWELPDLYELTGDKRFLDAALDGALHTVAGLFTHPILRAPDATRTLYPGNRTATNAPLWCWRGEERGRLGWDAGMLPPTGRRAPAVFHIPEKTVPDWLTSPVGLGIEQPSTFHNAFRPQMSPIMMSSWAAPLLRLAAQTGDPYWRVFARNTLAGRAATYPGYYLPDHIDLMHNPDYPRNGPDLTSFYWHHIPPHLAAVVDFVFADAEARTNGAVRFPWARQQGYVWFSNRLPTGAPGNVFGDTTARPWLDRDAFGADTPKLDLIGARGERRFHLIVLNQGLGETAARVRLDTGKTGVAPGARGVSRSGVAGDDGRTAGAPSVENLPPLGADGTLSLKLPRNGWAVLSFDAARDDFWPALKPLKTEPVALELPPEWGEGRVFRIRSPFGFDTLLVALTGRPENGRVTLLLDDKPPQTDAVFPFEFTVAGIAPEQDARLRLRLEVPGAPPVETETTVLPGTP